MKKVLMVGSAEQSKGGVSSVLKIMKKMPCWQQHACYWLGTQIQGEKPLKLYYAIKAYLIAFFTIWKYNIVHFHTVPDISLLVQFPVFLLAVLWKKKIILQLHVGNQIEDYKNSKLFHFCIKHSNLVLLLSPLWENKFDNLFSQFHVKSDYLYNAYLPVHSIDYKLHTKTIAYAAHMNANKAYDVLLKAFARIKDSYPDWKLIMMGDGEVDKAQQLAQKLDIERQVVFTGYITGQEKEKYFQEASIFCMCSYQEGFPMVVLEAWGYGIPVITTPVGGLPDVIEENKNAVTFGFGNDKELANKLSHIIEDYAKRESMSKYSHAYVSTKFSLSAISDKLSNIYSTL